MTVSHHGVAQDVGGLRELVLRDSAVEQDGPQQAGVVQVDGVVPVLKRQQTHTQTRSLAVTPGEVTAAPVAR